MAEILDGWSNLILVRQKYWYDKSCRSNNLRVVMDSHKTFNPKIISKLRACETRVRNESLYK